MKLFQKILVVILSVTMVFSAFPFAVFANDVDSEPDPREIVTPRYEDDIGVGKDGSITVTLSTQAIMDILSAIGDTDALKEKLGELLEMEGDLITLSDIMEIVPFDAILSIIMYDETNKNGLGRLVETLGGTHAVLELVDVDRIIASATRTIDPDNPGPDDIDDEGNVRDTIANVISIISGLEGFETAINTGAVLDLNISINYANLYQYVDFSKIRQKFIALSFEEKQKIFSDFDGYVNAVIAGLDGTLKDNDGNPLGIADLLDTTTTDPNKLEKVNGIVKELIEMDTTLLADVLADVIAKGYSVPDDAYEVKVDKVKALLNSNPTFKASMIQRITAPEDPTKPIITEAGMAKLAELLKNQIEITADDVEFILGDSEYLNLSVIIEALKDKNNENYFLTDAGTAALEAMLAENLTITADDVTFILGNESYLNISAIIDALKDSENNFLTDAGMAKLQDLLNSQITISAEDAAFILSDPDYLDTDVIVEAVGDPEKNFLTEAGMLAIVTATGFNPTPAQIIDVFSGHPEYYDADIMKSAITTAGLARLFEISGISPTAADAFAVFSEEGGDAYYDLETLKSAITPAGKLALAEAVGFAPTPEQIFAVLGQSDSYYDTSKVIEAITTAGKMAIWNAYHTTNPTVEQVLAVVPNDASYYDATKLPAAITEAGELALFTAYGTMPDVSVIISTIQGNAEYYDGEVLKTAITAAGKARLMQYLGFNPTPEQVMQVLSENPVYYNEETVKSAITNSGKLALYQEYGTQPTAEQVQALLDNSENYDEAKLYAVMNEAITEAGKMAMLERLLQQNRLTITPSDIQAVLEHSEYYDATKLYSALTAAITAIGKTALIDYLLANNRLTITSAQIQTILNNGEYYVSEKLYALLNQVLTSKGVAALAEKLLGEGRLNITDEVLQLFLNNSTYYDFTNLADAVLRALDDPGVNIQLAEVASVDVGKLMADANIGPYLRSKLNDYASRFAISDLMEIVNSYGGIQQFLSTEIYGYNSLIDLALTNVGGQYIYINVSSLVDLLLGGSLSNLPAILKEGESFATILRDGAVISTQSIMNAIHDSGQPLQNFIDFETIFNLLEGQSDKMGDLLRQVETKVLGEELGDNMSEILEALSDEQFNKLVMLSLQCGDIRIHRILLDGYEIAARSEEFGNPRYGHLNFDFNAIVTAIWSIIPKFEEIGSDDFDGLLTAFNFRMIYETVQTDQGGNPVVKEKDINLALQVEGNIDVIRRAGRVLDRYIKLEKTNNFFDLTLNIPAFVTDFYRYILEEGDSEAIANLRQKLLAMESMDGAEIAEALAQLPLSEVIAGLRDFDICDLYERIFNIGKVQSLLNKVQEYTNLHIDLDNISTLDNILDQFRRDDLSTIAVLLEQASEKFGTDLRASLEKVAKVLDENEYAQRLIERARSVPFIGKFFEGVTAQQVLQDYIDYNPIEAMVRYASAQLNKDFVSKFYSEKTVSEIYQSALTYAENHLSGAYQKVCNLIGRLLDPSYQPQNETLARILSYIPDGLISRIASTSLLQFYKGDSTFSATQTRGSLSLDNLSSRILQLAERIRPLDDDLKEYALALLPTGNFYFGSHVTVNFNGGLYRTDFYKKDGSKWFTCFLPGKIDPKIVLLPKVEGFEPFYWMDQPGEDGVQVTSIKQDQKLYPFYLEYFTVSYQYEGNEIGTEEVLDGYNLAEVPVDPDLPDQTHDWELRYYVGEDEIENIEEYIPTADVTITLVYVDVSTYYTVTYEYEEEEIGSETVQDGYGLANVPTVEEPDETHDWELRYYVNNVEINIAEYIPTADTVIVLKYVDVSTYYTVTYEYDGEEIGTETVQDGYGLANVPTVDEPDETHDWELRYYVGEDEIENIEEYIPTSDVTITLVYVDVSTYYTVTYEYEEEEIGTETVQDGNGLADVPADPDLPDQTHDWELRYYVNNVEINIAEYIPTADTVIVLKYVDVSTYYTVTYEYDEEELGSETVQDGYGLANIPADPELPDETHDWELRYYVGADEIENIEEYIPTSDVTITLVYVDVSTYYTVTYEYEEEEIGSETVQDGYGLANVPTVDEPDETHDWELRYYVGEDEIENIEEYIPSADVTIMLVYVDVSTYYTVTYEYEEEEIGSETVQDGYGLANVPTVDEPDETHDWELRYYVGEDEIENIEEYIPTADVTITLVYVDVSTYYTVTYEYEEEEIGSETVQDGNGLADVPADPDLPDQTHDWELRYYVNNVQIDIDTYIPTADVTIVLEYVDVTPQPTTYTVTYQYNGNTIGSETVVQNGKLANLPTAPQQPDQTHVWELRYYVNGTQINVSTYSVVGDVTVVLQYVDVTPQPTNYTVTYKYNGNTIGSETVAKNGKLANLPTAPQQPDDTHVWELRYYVNGSRINVSTYRVNNNVTVVLQYVDVTPQPTNYTVTYEYNGETIGSETVEKNAKLANIPRPEAPDDIHIWELRYFVNGTQINISTYRVTSDVTVVLVYVDVTPQPIFYTVTYEYDDEEIGSETVLKGGNLANIPTVEQPDDTHVWELRYYVGSKRIYNIESYTVNADVTITLKYVNVTPVGKTIPVFVQNTETGKYEVIRVVADADATLEDVLDLLPAWVGDDTLVGGGQSYNPHFFVINREDGEDVRIEMTDAVALTEQATSGAEYIVLYYPDYLVAQTDGDEDVNLLFADLTTDADGNWTLVLADALIFGADGSLTSVTDAENPNRFDLTLDTEAPDFAEANSLTVRYGDSTKIEMTGALMESLKQEGNGKMRFSIKLVIGERVFDSADESKIPFVQASAKEVYELELLVQVSDEDPESGVKIENFEGGMAITVKAVRVRVLDGTAGWRTNAYILVGEKALPDDLMVTVSETDGTITFRPPHFTEIGLVNEYYLDVAFEGSTEDGDVLIGGKPVGNGGYIPEGATLQSVTPALSEEAAKAHDIVSMYTEDGEPESGSDLLMPSAPMTITVVTQAKEVIVVINGEEIPAQIGDVLPVEIPVGPDEALTEFPEGGILVDVIEKEDGSKVYVFGIPVTPNPKPITYKIEKLKKTDYYVTNGIIGDEQPGVEYKVTKDTTFYTGTYHMEVRNSTGKACSLWWLWILLIILLIIAIIAILYLIIIKKALGPNVFTRIIVGIVTAFFMISLGVYSIFTGKAFKTKK